MFRDPAVKQSESLYPQWMSKQYLSDASVKISKETVSMQLGMEVLPGCTCELMLTSSRLQVFAARILSRCGTILKDPKYGNIPCPCLGNWFYMQHHRANDWSTRLATCSLVTSQAEFSLRYWSLMIQRAVASCTGSASIALVAESQKINEPRPKHSSTEGRSHFVS